MIVRSTRILISWKLHNDYSFRSSWPPSFSSALASIQRKASGVRPMSGTSYWHCIYAIPKLRGRGFARRPFSIIHQGSYFWLFCDVFGWILWYKGLHSEPSSDLTDLSSDIENPLKLRWRVHLRDLFISFFLRIKKLISKKSLLLGFFLEWMGFFFYGNKKIEGESLLEIELVH